jgi:hypothetical protein
MLQFSNLPYWKRAWVIQRIAVGSVVTLLSGKVQLDWDTFNHTLRDDLDPVHFAHAIRLQN